MTTLTANRDLKSLLSGIKVATEIRDDDGTMLGIFTPTMDMERLFDPEEMARRKLEKGGFTLNEIKEQLKSKGIQP